MKTFMDATRETALEFWGYFLGKKDGLGMKQNSFVYVLWMQTLENELLMKIIHPILVADFEKYS